MEGSSAAAIQRAINQAHNPRTGSVEGGTVFLPARTYTLEKTVKLYPNVSLEGVGERSVLVPESGATNRNLIALKRGNDALPHDISIRKLTLRGPGRGARITDDAAENYFRGCGIIVNEVDAENITISDCTLTNLSGCGILFRNRGFGAVKKVYISRCTAINNRRPRVKNDIQNYKDIYFYGTRFKDIRIQQNTCIFQFGTGETTAGPRIGNDSGIAFVTSRLDVDGEARNIVISGNECRGHYRHGIITFYGRVVHNGVSLTQNTCDNNGWMGLYFAANNKATDLVAERSVISSNYCNFNGFFDEANSTVRGGIVVGGGFQTIVSDNICNWNGRTSIDGVSAVANGQYASGIRVRGRGVMVESNIANNNRDRGISTWSSPSMDISIVSNLCRSNDKDGILIQGAAPADQQDTGRGFMAASNSCDKNKGAGIRVYYVNGALINGNYLRSNSRAGIALDSNTANVSLSGNLIESAADIPSIYNPGGDVNSVGDNDLINGAC